jgi:hypothetical protein
MFGDCASAKLLVPALDCTEDTLSVSVGAADDEMAVAGGGRDMSTPAELIYAALLADGGL